MSMIKDIQNFRDQASVILSSDSQSPGQAIIALAYTGKDGKPHPGAYHHVVVDLLEKAGDLNCRDRFKAALSQHNSDTIKALADIYAEV